MKTAMEIATALPKNRRNGKGWVACCPAHADKHPSLSIDEGRDGKVLLHCHAGCTQDEVIDALRQRGLWPEPLEHSRLRSKPCARAPATDQTPSLPGQTSSPPPDFAALLGTQPTDTWDYLDADGRVLGYTARVDRGGKKDVYSTVCKRPWRRLRRSWPRTRRAAACKAPRNALT